MFRLTPELAGYRDQRLLNFYRDVHTAIRVIPGVRSVALSDALLMSGWVSGNGGLYLPGRSALPEGNGIGCTVSESFFSTMGIPLVLGREFTAADNQSAPKVMVVNETIAHAFFQGENPIGRVVKMPGPMEMEVGGVCQDIKFDSLKDAAPPTTFLPYRQQVGQSGSMVFEVRTALPPLSLVRAVRKAVATIDDSIPVAGVTTQKQMLDQAIAPEKLFASLGGALALLAMLLSAIGLYGLMAYNVARRTGEIGIRMALGATRRQIAGPILREALLLAAFGVAIGLPGVIGLARLIRSQLYGVEPADPLTLACGVMVLLAIATGAAWVPAWRAARMNPMVALRRD